MLVVNEGTIISDPYTSIFKIRFQLEGDNDVSGQDFVISFILLIILIPYSLMYSQFLFHLHMSSLSYSTV
jgi:hypothetical protein